MRFGRDFERWAQEITPKRHYFGAKRWPASSRMH